MDYLCPLYDALISIHVPTDKARTIQLNLSNGSSPLAA